MVSSIVLLLTLIGLAGSKPLLQEADPLHSKLNMEYQCWYQMVQLKKSVLIYFRIGLRTNYIYLQFYRFETLGLHILHFGVVCLVIGCMQIFPLSSLTKTFLQKSEHQEIFFGPKLKILVRRLYFLSNKIIFCDLKWHSFQTGFMDSG